MKKKKLPNKILVIPSNHKAWHEKWNDNKDMLNFPHPYRLCICSVPNSGKTNVVKNILLRSSPYFKNIYLYHYDHDCDEYDDIDVIKLEEIPSPKDDRFTTKEKSILIVEDAKIDKKDMNKLDRLFGYTSTHRGLSIILISQDYFSLPVNIRRMCNIFCIWKNSSDFNSLYMIGKKFKLSKDEFMKLLNHCKTNFDFILLDKTNNTPYPIRKNGFELINGFNMI